MHTNFHFKVTYGVIQKYQETFDVHWYNYPEASIQTDTEVSVWATYVKAKICCHPTLYHFISINISSCMCREMLLSGPSATAGRSFLQSLKQYYL